MKSLVTDGDYTLTSNVYDGTITNCHNYWNPVIDASIISGDVPNHYNKEEVYTKLETNARIGYKMRNYVRKDVYHKHVGLLETTILQLSSKVQELERMTNELYYPMGK